MRYLIIIPGIGDDHVIYHVGAALFRLFGFHSRVRVFGWNGDPSSYQQRMDNLNQFIVGLDGPVYLLGVSAGGPAAVSAYAARGAAALNGGNIVRVATLCAPLSHFHYSVNPLLTVAIKQVETDLECMEQPLKQRILSVRGLHDQVVPLILSKPEGIRTAVIPSGHHGVNIFLGLTIFALPLLRFFSRP